MGTRSIILVTGKGNYGGSHQTVRIYKHYDGHPSDNLGIIARATETADALVANYRRFDNQCDISTMPAIGFAHCIIAASVSLHGFAAHVDDNDGFSTRSEDNDQAVTREAKAVFHEKLKKDHYGNQGDLEWVYVVDLRKRDIRVYSDANADRRGGPWALVKAGPVDPRSEIFGYVDREDVRRHYYVRVSDHYDKLVAMGWTVNGGMPLTVEPPPVREPEAATAV